VSWQDGLSTVAMICVNLAAAAAEAGPLMPLLWLPRRDRNPNATNLCCDAVWLPHFEFINVVGFSQDRVVRYGVQLGEGDAVAWWQHIQVRRGPWLAHLVLGKCLQFDSLFAVCRLRCTRPCRSMHSLLTRSTSACSCSTVTSTQNPPSTLFPAVSWCQGANNRRQCD
jgi:hypothetical protein